LGWLCDIARIMSRPTLNWSWIESQSSELGIVRIVRVSMILANRMLSAALPPPAQTKQGEDRVTLPLVEEIQSRIVSETALNVESLAYFRLMMRLRERPADRRRFLRRLVFTPGPSEWQQFVFPHRCFRCTGLSDWRGWR